MSALPPGAYTALVTPFTEGGAAVDWDAYERLLASQLDARIAGLVPCGTTGEGPTLSVAERAELVGRAAKAARGRAVVVAGVGTNDTAHSIETARAAVAAGADGVMLVMPYYNRPSQEGLYRHVLAVAGAVTCPVMLYNIPGRTGVELAVETLLRVLEACPNVVALKDASGGVLYTQELLDIAGSRLLVLSGDDPLTLPLIAVGASGVISVTSNLYPEGVVALVDAALAGRAKEALALNRRLYPVHRALFLEPNPVPIKAALALRGRSRADVRLPLVEAGASCRARLSELMARYEGA